MKKRSAFHLSYNIDVSPRSKGSARRLNILGPLRLVNYCRRPFRSDLGSVLNKDSSAVGVVIQGFRIEGGLDEEATLLAERCRVEAD